MSAREILAGLAGAILAAAILAGAQALEAPRDVAPAALPPCATEDSAGCYWDAETMGNGRGRDVVTLEAPAPAELEAAGR